MRYGEVTKQRLDRAVLIFHHFRKSYIGDQAMHSSKLYVWLSELLGPHDHLLILNVIVGKIASNLKCSAEGEEYSCLENYKCSRCRTTFYYTLGLLIFKEDDLLKFSSSMDPLLQVTTPLLKFMTEFVLHKSLRLTFDSLSPNGLLLVGEVSNLTVPYGSRILSLSNCRDMYTFKYKGIGIFLSILSRVLAGNYINFGVFGLYGGRALLDALDTVLKLIISIPFVGILAYQKDKATDWLSSKRKTRPQIGLAVSTQPPNSEQS